MRSETVLKNKKSGVWQRKNVPDLDWRVRSSRAFKAEEFGESSMWMSLMTTELGVLSETVNHVSYSSINKGK